MKLNKNHILFIMMLLCSISIFGSGSTEIYDNEYIPKTINHINSKELTNTLFVPTIENDIEYDKNIIFVSTFQLAWNELILNIFKEEIKLEKPVNYIKFLNNMLSTKGDLLEKSYIAECGFVSEGIIEIIHKKIKEYFNDYIELPVFISDIPDSIISYACLFKEFSYPIAFLGKYSIYFEGSTGRKSIEAFGVETLQQTELHNKLKEQIKIHFYDHNTDEAIISLVSDSEQDEIVLAKTRPKNSLFETFKYINGIMENNEVKKLDYKDTVKIPKVIFSITHIYKELIRNFFSNDGFQGHYIIQAIQDIVFRFDEKGIFLKSSAKIEHEKSAGYDIIFDKPFLLYLKEKDGMLPYLMIWFGNDELFIEEST